MNWASSGRRENRIVDFLHHGDGTRRFRSNHDTIGVEKISNGGSFPEKLGVRHHVKVQLINVVNGEMLPETLCGLYRDGALFDDQAISMRGRSNCASNRFNSAEVRFTVLQWWSADTDENCASLLDGFRGRREPQAARSDIALNERIQMGFKERQAPGIELF